MSPFFEALLKITAAAGVLSMTQAQSIASVAALYFAGPGCSNDLGLPTINLGIGSGVGVPLTVPVPGGPFAAAIVTSTSNIESISFCEHGCECFQSGCNTFTLSALEIGTDRCITTDTLVDDNGNPLFPGTQWDKLSVTII